MLPELKQKIYSPKQLQQHNFALGKIGENHAKEFLKQRGFLVLVENLQLQSGEEADLVCLEKFPLSNSQGKTSTEFDCCIEELNLENVSRHLGPKDTLVFVEVKTRLSSDYGWIGGSAISGYKIQHAQAVAREFRYQHRRDLGQLDYRFDIITILLDHLEGKPKIDHYENVTWLRRNYRL